MYYIKLYYIILYYIILYVCVYLKKCGNMRICFGTLHVGFINYLKKNVENHYKFGNKEPYIEHQLNNKTIWKTGNVYWSVFLVLEVSNIKCQGMTGSRGLMMVSYQLQAETGKVTNVSKIIGSLDLTNDDANKLEVGQWIGKYQSSGNSSWIFTAMLDHKRVQHVLPEEWDGVLPDMTKIGGSRCEFQFPSWDCKSCSWGDNLSVIINYIRIYQNR